jgi:cyclophilin family peptidyl-prolyl cis-trans isomerase
LICFVFACGLSGCSKSADDGASTSAPSANSQQPAPVAAPQQAAVVAAAKAALEQGDPIIAVHTSLGTLFVRLYERQAPRTVANFLDYARTGHYDGTIFHQVESGYVALGGAFDRQLKAKSVRYPVTNEAANGLKNVRGSLAMARDPGDPHSATATFFINLADNPKLDHRGTAPDEYGFCVFGQVIDGLDVLDKLSATQTAKVESFTSTPVERVVLNSIRMLRAARDPSVQPAGFNKSSAVETIHDRFPVAAQEFDPNLFDPQRIEAETDFAFYIAGGR